MGKPRTSRLWNQHLPINVIFILLWYCYPRYGNNWGLDTNRWVEKRYLRVNLQNPQSYSLYHSLMMKMKLILLATMLSLAFGSIPLSRQSSEENYSEDVDRAIGIFTTGNYWKELWRHTIWITRRWWWIAAGSVAAGWAAGAAMGSVVPGTGTVVGGLVGVTIGQFSDDLFGDYMRCIG